MKKLIIFSGIFLLIISIFLDEAIANNIIFYRNDFLTNVMSAFSFLGSALIIFLLTTLLFLRDKRKRSYIPVLWLTLLVSLIIGTIIKNLISRPRPGIIPLEFKNTFSFPSIHAVAVFAPLALIEKEFPKIKWIWLSFGILVLISRIYLGVHYFSDVIAGALFGYIIGILILYFTSNI